MTDPKPGDELHEKDPEKTLDLPPYGSRNADPITDNPGSHPIETGLGAVVGGAASGVAIGMVAGPVGAAIGAAVGAVAGGYAGKGVGELLDPTTQDNWLREHLDEQQLSPADADLPWYRAAYRFGVQAAYRHAAIGFDQAEPSLKGEWATSGVDTDKTWEEARGTVKAGFERARVGK